MKNVDERGTIMVLVMFITAMIAGMGVAYVATTTAQHTMVTESLDNTSYEQSAFSGFEVAKAFLLSRYTASTTGWDNELVSSTNTAYIASYDIANNAYHTSYDPLVPASSTGYTSWPFQWNRNIDYNDNTFRARIENNNDGGSATNDTDGVMKLIVEAWGPGNDPNMRQQPIVIEGMISYRKEPYAPTSAVVVGGSLKVFGNADIGGTNGSIQSNGSVTVTGSANIAGDVTAVGTVSAGAGQIDGSSNPYAEETNIPPIIPPDYKYLATNVFKTDGIVYDADNNPIWNTTIDGNYYGWDYSGGVWSKTANVVNNGVYYFEGSDVSFGGSAGSSSNPMTLTVIATGYVNVSGSPSLMPNPAGGGIALMAGKDLKMRGAGGNVYGTGLYAAHEQVSLVGTPTVNGCVLAEDFEDVCNLVSSSSSIEEYEAEIELGGNTSITYNGNLTTVLTDGYPYIKILGFKKRIKARD